MEKLIKHSNFTTKKFKVKLIFRRFCEKESKTNKKPFHLQQKSSLALRRIGSIFAMGTFSKENLDFREIKFETVKNRGI